MIKKLEELIGNTIVSTNDIIKSDGVIYIGKGKIFKICNVNINVQMIHLVSSDGSVYEIWGGEIKLFDRLDKIREDKINEILKWSILNQPISYKETISLPSNWDNHDYTDKHKHYDFISKNLNDCKIDNFI